MVSGSGDDDEDGIYAVQSSVWVRVRALSSAGIRQRVQGVEQSEALQMPSINAGNVELLGFDDQGRAILRLSDQSLLQLAVDMGIDTGIAARTAGVEQSEGDTPGIWLGNVEALGFDAYGRLLANPSPAFIRRVEAGLQGGADISGLFPLPSLVFWGDSMTQGAGGDGTNIVTTAASYLDRVGSNRGLGGQDTHQIAIRAGAWPLYVELEGDTIPASGAAAVTYYSTNILTNGGSPYGSCRAIIAGVPGTLESNVSDYNWTFTRDEAGTEVALDGETLAVLDPDAGTASIPSPEQYRDWTVVIWAGRNNRPNSRETVREYRDYLVAMARHLTPRAKHYFVVSIVNGDGERLGSVGYDYVAAANAELRATFGDHYLDLRSYMVQHAIYDAGLTPTSDDLDAIALDTPPPQLRSDAGGNHFIGAGYEQAGLFIARNIAARGW